MNLVEGKVETINKELNRIADWFQTWDGPWQRVVTKRNAIREWMSLDKKKRFAKAKVEYEKKRRKLGQSEAKPNEYDALRRWYKGEKDRITEEVYVKWLPTVLKLYRSEKRRWEQILAKRKSKRQNEESMMHRSLYVDLVMYEAISPEGAARLIVKESRLDENWFDVALNLVRNYWQYAAAGGTAFVALWGWLRHKLGRGQKWMAAEAAMRAALPPVEEYQDQLSEVFKVLGGKLESGAVDMPTLARLLRRYRGDITDLRRALDQDIRDYRKWQEKAKAAADEFLGDAFKGRYPVGLDRVLDALKQLRRHVVTLQELMSKAA